MDLFAVAVLLRTPFPRRTDMPKKAVWLLIVFTLLYLLGVNTGDLDYLMNLGNTICLACIGVG